MRQEPYHMEQVKEQNKVAADEWLRKRHFLDTLSEGVQDSRIISLSVLLNDAYLDGYSEGAYDYGDQ